MKIRDKGNGRFSEAPASDQEAMVAAYLAGDGLRCAGRRFGYSSTAVALAMRRRGVASRSLADARREYAVNDLYFHQIDCEQKAYWLGFIAADGCAIKSGACRYLQVTLQRRDVNHIRQLAEHMAFKGPIHFYRGQDGIRRPCLRVCSSRVADDLERIGIFPAKTASVKPWRGPDGLLRHYWRGVVDGDGSLYQANQTKQWCIALNGNQVMVEGFASFVQNKTGEKAIVRRDRDTNSFYVRYGAMRVCKEICRLLCGGATVFLDRKMDAANQIAAVEPASRGRPWR